MYSPSCTKKELSDAALQMAHLELSRHGHGSDEALHYLYKSAIAELEDGIATGSGLPTLAIELWIRGETELACTAMKAAIENGASSGAHATVAALAPYSALAQKVDVSKRNIAIGVAIFAFLLFIAAITGWARARTEALKSTNHPATDGTRQHAHE